jgi:hypothetical protein
MLKMQSYLILYIIPSRGVNQFLLNKNAIEHTYDTLTKFEV